VEVIWKTTNWGEPKVTIDNFQNKQTLRKNCDGTDCDYDGTLLKGLKDEILASKKSKVLVSYYIPVRATVLHITKSIQSNLKNLHQSVKVLSWPTAPNKN
jgi:hypothetical protein